MNSWRSALSDFEEAVHDATSSRLIESIATLRQAAGSCVDTDLDEIAAIAAMHRLPWVRQVLLQALAIRAPEYPEVRQMVAWLTHDYEDFVAFQAINAAGRLRIEDVLADLFVIVGRASERVQNAAGKPVGVGHAVVLRAIIAIIGSPEPADILGVEQKLFGSGVDTQRYEPQQPVEASVLGTHRHKGMVRVPGGTVRGGPPPSFEAQSLVLDWNDPERLGSCEDFWLDVLPVSNDEYDSFAISSAAQSHTFCHPAEPPGKLHFRNTLLDARSGPDHPVTGVDWFDAYAYARAHGKRLPTEVEWQRAGEGDERRAYPWGEIFDPLRTHCHGASNLKGWNLIEAWRADLLDMVDRAPSVTTRDRDIAGSMSPYGVKDLSGNVWEWTSSSFDGPPFSPVDPARDAIDVIYDPRSYVVIKGGTWTSIPEQVSVAFRGRDLALDRHFEIGFRCACSCADAAGES